MSLRYEFFEQATERLPYGMRPSPFTDKAQWLGETSLAFAMINFFPSTQGHVMVLPRDFAVYRFFELAKDEIKEHHRFASFLRKDFNRHFQPDGFNIGWNINFEGGQSIAHAHMHIMPRYESVNKEHGINPLGGVSRLPFSRLPEYLEKEVAPDPLLLERFYNELPVLAENEYAIAVPLTRNLSVSPGHCYILPKSRHADFFQSNPDEVLGQLELAMTVMKMQSGSNQVPEGYNIGWDVGMSGGQTIPCSYLQVVPRYRDDMEVPRGGIVKIIPEKAWPFSTDYYDKKNVGKDVALQRTVEFPFTYWETPERRNILKFD